MTTNSAPHPQEISQRTFLKCHSIRSSQTLRTYSSTHASLSVHFIVTMGLAAQEQNDIKRKSKLKKHPDIISSQNRDFIHTSCWKPPIDLHLASSHNIQHAPHLTILKKISIFCCDFKSTCTSLKCIILSMKTPQSHGHSFSSSCELAQSIACRSTHTMSTRMGLQSKMGLVLQSLHRSHKGAHLSRHHVPTRMGSQLTLGLMLESLYPSTQTLTHKSLSSTTHHMQQLLGVTPFDVQLKDHIPKLQFPGFTLSESFNHKQTDPNSWKTSNSTHKTQTKINKATHQHLVKI